MTRPRSIAPLAMACCLLAPLAPGRAVAQTTTPPPVVGSITALTEPMTRQVIQRRDNNIGSILVVGTYTGNVDGFQASSNLQPGVKGTPLGWTPLIDVTILDGNFIGLFRQPAGGFYNILVRPMYQGQAGQPAAVLGVGVGEVFITAGQSNSTSNGTPTGFLPSLQVSCFNEGTAYGIDPAYPGAFWRWGYDPQPAVDSSTGGSVWPTMATNLSNALGVPVGLYAVGCGGTSLGEWLPGQFHFTRLTNAIRYLAERGGVRAVLWDQGETDYGAQTSPAAYQVGLQRLIDQSRAVSAVPVKWMVAQAASCLTDNMTERLGLEQAQAAVVDNIMTFPGPNTDMLWLTYRIEVAGGPLHFNAMGLVLLGGYWGIYVANLPGFLGTGYLPPPPG